MSPVSETPSRGVAIATILLVDDDENSRILRDGACAPRLSRHHGQRRVDAIRVAREVRPNVILLDIVMDGVDGNATMRALRADPITRSIPSFALTARGLSHQRREMLDAGFDDVLVKPLPPKSVILVVEKALGR